MKEKSCAILGSQPLSFPWGYDEEDPGCAALKLLLLNRITFLRSEGVTAFYVVMDAGIGLYAAEMINSLRENDEALHLLCVIPWEGQATQWTPELRERYFNAQAKCSDVLTIATAKTADCEVAAMINAIDMADTVLAIYREEDAHLPVALRYAERVGKQAVVIG